MRDADVEYFIWGRVGMRFVTEVGFVTSSAHGKAEEGCGQ